jgi:hypothetical protein
MGRRARGWATRALLSMLLLHEYISLQIYVVAFNIIPLKVKVKPSHQTLRVPGG